MKRARYIFFCIFLFLTCTAIYDLKIGWNQDLYTRIKNAQNLQLEVNEGRKHPIRFMLDKDSPQYQELLIWAKNNSSGWRWNYLFFIDAVPGMEIYPLDGDWFCVDINPQKNVFLSYNHKNFYKKITPEDYKHLRETVFGNPIP